MLLCSVSFIMYQVKLEPGLHKDKDKKKPHIKKPLNAFMLYMKVI